MGGGGVEFHDGMVIALGKAVNGNSRIIEI
jgi:hypothetical protein